VRFKEKEVHVQGLTLPSSETFLHWFIYKKRKDVKAIFHGHNKKILEKATKLRNDSISERSFKSFK